MKSEFESKKREGLNKIKDEYNKLCQQVNLDAKALMQVINRQHNLKKQQL
jgi:hypothetical protein